MEVHAGMGLLLGHPEGHVAAHISRQGQWKLKSCITVPAPAETSHLLHIYILRKKGLRDEVKLRSKHSSLRWKCPPPLALTHLHSWSSVTGSQPLSGSPPLTTSEPAGMGPQSHHLNRDVYPLSVGDPSVDQHLWHRDAKNMVPADHRPFQGSLHTHIYNLFMRQGYVYICFWTLFRLFMPQKKANTESQFFKHFREIFVQPSVKPPTPLLSLYSSLSSGFVIPPAPRCQHCGGSHSPKPAHLSPHLQKSANTFCTNT